jgi:hypothetical protein
MHDRYFYARSGADSALALSELLKKERPRKKQDATGATSMLDMVIKAVGASVSQERGDGLRSAMAIAGKRTTAA